MATIKVSTFAGMIPALNETVLPDNNAALARDAFLYSGAVQGFAELKTLRNLANPSYATVYRIPNNYLDAAHLTEAAWMEFIPQYADVVRTAVVGDTYERFYWAQPGSVPYYNTKTRIVAGNTGANAPFYLGIPTPAYTPTLSVAGGSGTTATRAYVVTYLSAYGEEGPPSPAITVTGFINGTWNLGVTALIDANRNITKQRIYRTVTSSQGVTTYFLVAEVNNTTATYGDVLSDTTISANQQLQSLTWSGPPSDLVGWVSMPNGIIAGWRGKEIWFCEPYRPHAWPSSYALSTEYNIVGLGVYGTTLVVCTEGFPTAITGINPASMTMAKVSTFEPCMSRGSVVSAPEGVYYASPNGLILAGQGQFVNITKSYITKDKWQELLKVATLRAVHLGSGWLAFGGIRAGCFESTAFNTSAFEQTDYTGAYQGLFVDPSNQNAITTMSSSLPITNVQTDPWSGEIFVIVDGKVKWFDFQSIDRVSLPYLWRSKQFQGNKIDNFSAVKVYFHIPPGITWTPTGARNNALVQTLGANQYGLFRFYADSKLIATREIRTSGEMFRLPSGFKASYWQFEIEARVHVTSVQMATSAKELASV